MNPSDVPLAADLRTAIIHYPSGVSIELFKTSDNGFLKTLLEYPVPKQQQSLLSLP